MLVFEASELNQLIHFLYKDGYEVIGPTVREGVINYLPIASSADLPQGWTDEQAPGTYRLTARTDAAYFGYVNSPQSWKRYLHEPQVRLWAAQKNGQGFVIEETPPEITKRALLGVRACELQAIAVQDRVFMESGVMDPHYQAKREAVLIIAVNCGQASGTCFCTSMGSGPGVEAGYDIALTELVGEEHLFVAESGSEAGERLLGLLVTRPATAVERSRAAQVVLQTAKQISKQVDTQGIQEMLYRNYEHPQWEAVAQRCLSCANCTQVCPTCFCTTVEDVTSLNGRSAERVRRWDSCFTSDFSYIHGGAVRQNTRARYRQWLTHKFATWQDQFDQQGCVGCGRCVTWCPVGIDITAELAAIRGEKHES